MGATPSPPPTSTTVPSSLRIWLGKPRGPMKSRIVSPSRNANISKVVLPTAWTTTVTVPDPALKSATVSGIRSPCSSMRAMIKCPGRAARATSGAFTSQRKVVGPNCILRLMRNTTPPGRTMVTKNQEKRVLRWPASTITKCYREPLAYARGSDRSHDRQGVVFPHLFRSAFGPRRRNAVHARVRHQLPHVLVGVDNDPEVHAFHCGISVHDLDFALEVRGFQARVGALDGLQ